MPPVKPPNKEVLGAYQETVRDALVRLHKTFTGRDPNRSEQADVERHVAEATHQFATMTNPPRKK